ncbi:MAG: hypothetical protein ACYDBQ_10775 [Thermoplasmatota archaeon]
MAKRRILWALVAAVAALLPAAAGPAAPAPADNFFRLLEDQAGDCDSGACHGSHDLLALDLAEVATSSGSGLAWRLWMGPASRWPVTDDVSFQAQGTNHSFAVTTRDDRTFSSPGLDAVRLAGGNGSRFAVEVTGPLSAFRLSGGERLTQFQVSSSAGAPGDAMPGAPCACGAGGPGSRYVRARYDLQGPTYYVRMNAQGALQVVLPDDDHVVLVDLENLFGDEAQNVTVRASGADGVTAGFHSGDLSGAEYAPLLNVTVPPLADAVLHLNLHGDRDGASGNLTLIATTDLGGRVEATIPYVVSATLVPPDQATVAPPSSRAAGLGWGEALAAIALAVEVGAWGRRP